MPNHGQPSMGQRAPLIRALALIYGLLIVHACLYPFSGWHRPGLPLFDFLWAPWPRYWRVEDLAFNVVAYIPFGFLLQATCPPLWKALPRVGAAVGVASLLSLSLETIQYFLESRISSNVDLACNTLGALLGALLGIGFGQRLFGRKSAFLTIRSEGFTPGRVGDVGFALCLLWLFGQFSPYAGFFPTHPLPGLPALQKPVFEPALFIWLEAGLTLTGLLALGFYLRAQANKVSQRLCAWLLVAGIALKILAGLLFFVPPQPWQWISPGVRYGLAAGGILFAFTLLVSRRHAIGFALLCLCAGMVLVLVRPENPYLALVPFSMKSGNFVTFEGLVGFVAGIWPLLAMFHLIWLAWAISPFSVFPVFFPLRQKTMSYFKHHVFFCCNERPDGEACCAAQGGAQLFRHAKERVAHLGLQGQGGIRINKAGCLGRCDEGPVVVIYPENVWYTVVDTEDVDAIIDTHLIAGESVARLKLPDACGG
jgi:(2Fe-2S) ferredoxin/VanZ family protein